MFTLSTNKVYVGVVNTLQSTSNQRKYVAITPFISGYRDKDTSDFVITTNYYHIIAPFLKDSSVLINGLTLEDFDIVIPIDNISYCHLFDQRTYLNFLDRKNSESGIVDAPA